MGKKKKKKKLPNYMMPAIPPKLKRVYNRRVAHLTKQIVLLEAEARRFYHRSRAKIDLRKSEYVKQRKSLVAPVLSRRREDVAKEREILRRDVTDKAKKAAFLRKAKSLWKEIEGLEKAKRAALDWFREELAGQ